MRLTTDGSPPGSAAEQDATATGSGPDSPGHVEPPAHRASRRGARAEAWLTATTWVVVAFGVALRMRQWLFGRPLWVDELLLHRSMRGQTFGSLLHPLPGSQSAPIGWLWAQHVVMRTFGDSERALRLLPLIFGCATLVVAVLLARRLVSPPTVLAVACLLSFWPWLIYYSNEFKQYSSDAFWTLLVLLLAVRLASRPDPRWRQVAAFGGAAAVAVWFSTATALTVGGVFGALALVALAQRRWRRLGMIIAGAVPVMVTLAAGYALVLSTNATDPALQAYWKRTFPPTPLGLHNYADWVRRIGLGLLVRPLNLRPWGLAVALLVAGAAVLAVRHRQALLILLLPAAAPALVLVAASLDLWALPPKGAGRLIGVGLAAAALAGLVALAVPNARVATRGAIRPWVGEDARTVMRYVATHRKPGDIVLVDQRATIYAAQYYSPRVGMRPFGTIALVSKGSGCIPGLAQSWLSAREHGTAWVVYSHVTPPEIRRYRAYMATVGHHVTWIPAPGASVDLYDLAAAPDDPGGVHMRPAPGHDCVQLNDNPPPA